MAANVRDLLRILSALEPLDIPDGESGVVLAGESGRERKCAPVLSIYLDMRPESTGGRPALRPARILLRERLHEIEKTFFPRGVVYESVRADAARIGEYLNTQLSPDVQGVAIFASAQHHLFETLETTVPFATEVAARAEPDLFQLARLLDDRETAIVAVVDTHAARLFVLARGLLREVRGLSEDPKYFHKVRGINVMNQGHYLSYTESRRARFAQQTAERLEQLVGEEHATQVILAGEQGPASLVRQSLSPQAAQLVRDAPVRLEIEALPETIREEIEPLIRETLAERDRAIAERLVGAVQSGGLGVAGLDLTRAALERGQADTLVLATDAPLGEEMRSQLIELATQTDASVEIVQPSAVLTQLGGVGALLRYRYANAGGAGVYVAPAGTAG